ncbi:hypothetical protein ACOSQ3_028681 [Xanthoceras sorbifolium]
MCVDLKHKQDGSSKHKQVPSDDSACIQLLTNSGEYAQVTASSYLASSNLKQQSLASSDHNVDCDHRHYDVVVVLISSQRTTMSLEDAQFLLLMHEQRIEQLNSANQVTLGSVFANFTANNAADKRDQRAGGNYNKNWSRGRGKSGRSGGRKLYCQLCTKPGHHAFQCYHRFDQHFQRPSPAHSSNKAYIGQILQPFDQNNSAL